MERDHPAQREGGNIASTEDVALFDRLFREQYRPLHAFLVGQTGDNDLARDLLQETFVRVWQRMETVRQIAPTQQRYWLFTLARHIVIDHRRRHRTRQHLNAPLPAEITIPAGKQTDPEAVFSANETQGAIDAAIRCLPADLRTVLTLHLLGEMTSEEMGSLLGIPAGTVRYRLLQARQRIAKSIGLLTAKKKGITSHATE